MVGVGVGSGRGGVVGTGGGSYVGSKLGVAVNAGVGGSCVEQPDTIKVADTKIMATIRFVDMASSGRSSLQDLSREWYSASCIGQKSHSCALETHQPVRPYHTPSLWVILENPKL
jgi:hypothetical protein